MNRSDINRDTYIAETTPGSRESGWEGAEGVSGRAGDRSEA